MPAQLLPVGGVKRRDVVPSGREHRDVGVRLSHRPSPGRHCVSKRSGRPSGQTTLCRAWHRRLDLEEKRDVLALKIPDALFDPQQDPQGPVVLLQVPLRVRSRHVLQAQFRRSERLSGHTNGA